MNGAIQAKHRALVALGAPPTWRLRSLAVCASTETELAGWLERRPPAERLTEPRLVVARRQCFGHGQLGRRWESPAGGVWLSAALPWPAEPQDAAAPGLAVALALAQALIARGAPVRLKWPNDLLLLTPAGPRKLAGLLPGLRLRGSRIRWARIGLGLNGRNPVPLGAANLRRQPGLWHGEPLALTALVLRALERAMALAADGEAVRRDAEALLHPPDPQWLDGAWWQPQGLEQDGGLRLVQGDGRQRILRRF
jgi:BirA family biotin operon repressor/biotin-[acetyl-CoA-carboxylase] ligase